MRHTGRGLTEKSVREYSKSHVVLIAHVLVIPALQQAPATLTYIGNEFT